MWQSAGSTSGTVYQPPLGRGTQSHGCGPLARWVLLTGQCVAGGSRRLGPWPNPPPTRPAEHSCQTCPRVDPHPHTPLA